MNPWFMVAAISFAVVAVLVWQLVSTAPPAVARPMSVSQALKKPKKKKRKVSHQEQFGEWWQRGGFSQSRSINTLLLCFIVMVSVLGFVSIGIVGAILGVVTSLLFLIFIAQWRKAKLQRQIINQLPSFIDQVNRRIQVGVSLPRAIEQSAKTTPKPLSSILQRVNQRRLMGVELQDAFYKEWRITGVVPFRLLGSIFNINSHFGGSINDSLESVVKLLRQQDSSRRELSSMTGETRVTAWVIGTAPLIVAGYLLSQSPDMLLDMWQSEAGRTMLISAIGLEFAGIIIIWRMLKSL